MADVEKNLPLLQGKSWGQNEVVLLIYSVCELLASHNFLKKRSIGRETRIQQIIFMH